MSYIFTKINRCCYAAKSLFIGLVTAQILATIHVYLSNADLYRTLIAAKAAGYLTIPNQRTMHSLQELGPAFFGGLFFTLTVGAGLSIFAIAVAWVWDHFLFRNKYFLVLLLLPWAVSLIMINSHGICPMVTLYFLFIPVVVFVSALRWMSPQETQRIWTTIIVHFFPIVLLAFLWAYQMNIYMFVDIRDNLLLSNPVGIKINDFYYKYTLYPAEAFKPLKQKTLKTCSLEGIEEKAIADLLEKELLHHDYLILGGEVPVDLQIIAQGNILTFKRRGETILQTPLENFHSRPGDVLKEFSLRADRYALFRVFTFLCILIAFPITLYIAIHTLFSLVLSFFLEAKASLIFASILCFLGGIALLGSFVLGRGESPGMGDLAQALGSERWQDRVRALKIVEQKGIEIADFPGYEKTLLSPYIPERYWLVKALGKSRRPETYKALLGFLDDPHSNVVCMAFSALGKRKETRAINVIKKRIETSELWYSQRYAYNALRSLGWKQTRLR